MALLGIIRRWHLRDQVPLREIAKRLGISRNTVRRYLRSETTEPAYAERQSASAIDPYAFQLSGWLKTEAAKSRKQRRSLKQLHEDLSELGFKGSYDRVAAFARQWREGQTEWVNSARKRTIMCVGPRIPETWNGKNVALENDLCLCGCVNPPRLLPSQFLRYQNISDATADSTQAAAIAASTSTMFDDRYVLIDEDTGEPLTNAEYALKGPSGKFEFGTTDANGHTHLIATSATAESIDIFL